MKRSKMIPEYEAEINKLAEEHLGALLDLSATWYENGMRAGQRNALLFMAIGCVAVGVSATLAGISYLERKERQS